ncbi:MAG: hypothetical protein IJH79_10245 [Lentisphaeria bacterium]|nr:hypothetical protein [Lentisphaeria bacterium]
MKAKTLSALLLFSVFALPAVDLNPLSPERKIGLDFNYGIGSLQTGGKVENEPHSFIRNGLILRGNASAFHEFSVPENLREFTFWFFFNSNNTSDNPAAAVLDFGKDSLVFGFQPQNGSPCLLFCRDGREVAAVRTSIHIDGEAWRMFAVRCKNGVTELIINGVPAGSLKADLHVGRKAKLRLSGKTVQENADTANRYDNIYFYARAFDNAVMADHFRDEMRTSRTLQLVKTPPRERPSQYIYEFHADAPANVLSNGSFEYGMRGWHAEGPRSDKLGNEYRGSVGLIENEAPDGKFKYRFGHAAEKLQHFPVYIRKPGDFTIRFQARGTAPKSQVTVKMFRLNTFAAPRNSYERSFALSGGQFRSCRVSGNLPEDAKAVFFQFSGDAGVEIDQVEFSGALEKGNCVKSAPALLMACRKAYHVFFEDDKLELEIRGTEPGLSGELAVFDEKDREQYRTRISGDGNVVLPFQRKGAFRAVAFVNGRPTDELIFSRLFKPHPDRPGKSRFGSHFTNSPFGLEFGTVIGSRWNRNHDAGPYAARWTLKTLPSAGKFQYRFDILEANRQAGQTLIATVTAPWKEKDSSPADFGRELALVVKNYRGKLKYLEIFNEPTAWFPPGRYAAFLAEAYRQVKAVDPEVKILGLSTWDVVGKFTRTVTETASCDKMDIFSAHFYNWGAGAWLIPDGNWGQGFRMRKLRNYLDSRPGGGKVVIWHTETGIYMDSFFLHHPHQLADTRYVRSSSYPHHPPRLGAVWMSQLFPVNFANGARVVTYYAWGPTIGGMLRMNGHNMGEIDGSLKPSAAAFSASAHFLDYSEFIKGIDDLGPNGLRIFQFRRSGRDLVVAWTQRPAPLYLKKMPSIVYDYMGNLCGREIPTEAFLNYNGVQKPYAIPAADRGRFFLDLEPRYFPDMTLEQFIRLLPDRETIKIHKPQGEKQK